MNQGYRVLGRLNQRNALYYGLGVPEKGVYFVFGSNLRGRHGAGAAYAAARYYGAQEGAFQGITGQCYAIPTKDWYIETLPLGDIGERIARFVRHTHENPQMTHLVTAIGTGRAGYQHADIAPLFEGAINCWFPLEWENYLSEEMFR